LREYLHIDNWLLLGGSWGSMLALAYAQAYSARVSEMVMWGVTTGRHIEFDWLFRGGVSVLFPEQWQSLRDALPEGERDGDIVAAYYRRLNDPDATIREQAALAWCRWESATPNWPPSNELSPRFREARFRMAFARIVTHYVHHNAWLEDGILLRHIGRLAKIPAVLISGRFDFQSPLKWAWDLARAWPSSRLVVVDDAGHDASNAHVTEELIRATDRLA
ncbi:MAG TPA: alpha/beta fold hydrolase, partial [Candidatus Binataceae bacterium]|nr:alpha/beta fold hydrolase [Candidatus Binataceae bacterium]